MLNEIFGEILVRPPVIRNQVFITRTAKISDRVVDAVQSGIALMCNITRADIKIRDLRNWGMNEDPGQPYMSLAWYQEQSGLQIDRGFGQQVDASQMLYMALDEKWQKTTPHLEAMIIDRDANMYSGGALINFCFAVAKHHFGFVLSTARFTSLPEQQLFSVIRRTAAHEFGHVLGLISRDFNVEDSLGKHCNGKKGPCLMRQGFSLKTWLKHLEEERTAGQEICPDCKNELSQKAID